MLFGLEHTYGSILAMTRSRVINCDTQNLKQMVGKCIGMSIMTFSVLWSLSHSIALWETRGRTRRQDFADSCGTVAALSWTKPSSSLLSVLGVPLPHQLPASS